MRSLMTLARRLVATGVFVCAASLATLHAETSARGPAAVLRVSADRVSFYAAQDGSTPTAALVRSIVLTNDGATAINWTIFPHDAWLVLDRRIGTIEPGQSTTIGVGADISSATPGSQTGTLTIWDADAVELLHTVTAFLRVCVGVCVSLNAADPGHTVSPLLFGSQIDWLNSGTYLLNKPASPSCTTPGLEGGTMVPGTLANLQQLGLRVLRYPSGISADFFFWWMATGPIAMRLPQIDAYKRSVFLGLDFRECPVFGPDEFTAVAGALGTQILTVANVGLGTPEMASGWLAYNLQRGIQAKYWEIGNEIYLPGLPIGDPTGAPFMFAAVYKTPENYAAAFDKYARALRAVDPTVKVGAIADPNGSPWSPEAPWNDIAFSKIQERVDFVATHLLFHTCTLFMSSEQVYPILMAAPAVVEHQLDYLKTTLQRSAAAINKNADIAVTEHSPFFWCFDYQRNHSLASALYTALTYNVFLREPRVVMATHSNLTHPVNQAPLTITASGAGLQSAFFHVFRAYSQTAGGRVARSSVLGSPTFSSEALGSFPAQTNVPVLDAVAVEGPDPGTWRLYVVNRSLQNDVTARVSLDALPVQIGSVTMSVVNGASYEAENSALTPEGVRTTSAPLPSAAEFEVTFPAHSLVILAVQSPR